MTAEDPYRAANPSAPDNEALQQTRSALTPIAAALAAERRCSPDLAGPSTSTRDDDGGDP